MTAAGPAVIAGRRERGATRWATLRYGSTSLDLAGERPPALTWALRFLAPHFVLEADGGETAAPCTATLELTALRSDLPPCAERADARAMFVRKSTNPFFTIPARSVHVDGIEVVECVEDATTIAFDAAARRVRVYAPDSAGLILVELIRDIVLKAEENAGAVVLHAAALAVAGEAVLVVGGKGSGKSTTVLELVRHHGMSLLSGDRVPVTDADVAPRVSGWPDYPHLGYATIVKHPGLAALAGIDPGEQAPDGHAFSATGKYPLDPFGFRELFASSDRTTGLRVRALLLPAIGPGSATTLDAAAPDEAREHLHAHVTSAFSTSAGTWNAFTRPEAGGPDAARVLDRLALAPAYRLRGPGDLAGVTLPDTIGGGAS